MDESGEFRTYYSVSWVGERLIEKLFEAMIPFSKGDRSDSGAEGQR